MHCVILDWIVDQQKQNKKNKTKTNKHPPPQILIKRALMRQNLTKDNRLKYCVNINF